MVFAIGMKSAANYSQLEVAASSEEFIRIYETMDDFADDAADMMYKTCWIAPSVDAEKDILLELALEALRLGETRYLRIGYKDGEMMNVLIEGSPLDFTAYFSYNFPFPSASNHDIRIDIAQGERKSLAIPLGKKCPRCSIQTLGKFMKSLIAFFR